MKTFFIRLATGAMIAATVLGPLAEAQAAQPNRIVHQTVREGPRGHLTAHRTTVVRNDQRRWAKGQRFDRRNATSYRVIDNPRAYRLSAPPRGYHWVRSGNDAVMVAITSGVIGAVIANALR
jgi:Ni/Co efflux regulator RcnB